MVVLPGRCNLDAVCGIDEVMIMSVAASLSLLDSIDRGEVCERAVVLWFLFVVCTRHSHSASALCRRDGSARHARGRGDPPTRGCGRGGARAACSCSARPTVDGGQGRGTKQRERWSKLQIGCWRATTPYARSWWCSIATRSSRGLVDASCEATDVLEIVLAQK